MKTIRSIGILIALTGIVGCAAALPPQDLVNARNAYDRASKGPATPLDPADLHNAKVQLDLAEASFAQDGDTQDTRDKSYVAVRKTELAEARARTLAANNAKEGVVGAMHADQTKVVARTAAELGRTKTELSLTGIALQDETTRRQDAERRAAQAAADLAKFATVKQEPRGMVITLSGSVLFASAKWDLLPTAQLKLNDVANALTKEDPLSRMVSKGTPTLKGRCRTIRTCRSTEHKSCATTW